MGVLKQILRKILGTSGSDSDSDNMIKYVRQHRRYLILLFVLAIIYISNGLIYELEIRKQNSLERDLLKVKVKYNIKLNEFRKFGNYQNINELLNKHGLNLEEPATPPIMVEK
jgi:hypothetical protein